MKELFIPEQFKHVKLYMNESGVQTTAFNSSYNKQMPNVNGKISIGKNITLYDVFNDYVCNEQYARICNSKATKYNSVKTNEKPKKGKDFAYGIWGFQNYRYAKNDKIYDVDENGAIIKDKNGKPKYHMLETNLCYMMWNGFQGIDTDFPKDKFSDDEIVELANRLKPKLYNYLKKFSWFAGITLSTGGHGLHFYISHKVPYFDNTEYAQRYYNTFYDYIAFHIICAYYSTDEDIDWFSMPKLVDMAMKKPEQPLNITVMDNKPLLNDNFKYTAIADIWDLVDEEKEFNISQEVYDNASEKAKKAIDYFNNNFRTDTNSKRFEKVTKQEDYIINYECTVNKDYDLSNMKPYHWRHAQQKSLKDEWSGFAVTHTLLCFYSPDEVKQIWEEDNFYDEDPKDWIRYVDTCVARKSEYPPNAKLVEFLNSCGFNLTLKTKEDLTKKYNDYNYIFELKDNEYIGTKLDELEKCLKLGINLVDSGTGTGKTTVWVNQNREKINDILNHDKPVLVCEPLNSIIETKYKNNEVVKICGEKQFDLTYVGNMMYVTNYNHIISRKFNEKEAYKFKYIVIDESHLLTKEYFRNDVLIKFINKVKEIAKYVPVILQTGTPMDETKIFDVCNKIKFIKKSDKNIKFIYRYFEPTLNYKQFDITNVICLTRYYISKGRKVYIYWNNISKDKCDEFKTLFPELKVAVYHKKHFDDIENEDMKFINQYHMLGNQYDVLISSVYFGVGNDLNDECPAACIIIGNNCWQEDIQVIGRWRNSKDIEVCQIITKESDVYSYNELDYDLMYKYKFKNISYNYNDATNRDKSIIIGSKTYMINDEKDISLLTYMSIAELYYSNIALKNKMLLEYCIDVDFDMNNQLIVKEDYIDRQKAYKQNLKNIRNEIRNSVLNDIVNEVPIKYSNINKIENYQKAFSTLYKYNKDVFDDLIVNDETSFSMTDTVKLFNQMSFNNKFDEVDWAEVKAFIKYRECILSMTKEQKESLFQDAIEYEELYAIICYIIFYHYKNIDSDNNEILKGNYFKEFKDKANIFSKMTDMMIDKLNTHIKRTYETNNIDVYDDIFYTFETKETVEVKTVDDMIERIQNHGLLKLNELNMYRTMLYQATHKKSLNGRIGGQKTKRLKATKDMLKYNIHMNDEFESCKEVAKLSGKTLKSISSWIKKKWLIEL